MNEILSGRHFQSITQNTGSLQNRAFPDKTCRNYDKGTYGLSWQQVAFLEKCRKSKGCGSLEEDVYTGFIPNFSAVGAVTWLEHESYVL